MIGIDEHKFVHSVTMADMTPPGQPESSACRLAGAPPDRNPGETQTHAGWRLRSSDRESCTRRGTLTRRPPWVPRKEVSHRAVPGVNGVHSQVSSVALMRVCPASRTKTQESTGERQESV